MLKNRLIKLKDVVILEAIENMSPLLAKAHQADRLQCPQLVGDGGLVHLKDDRQIPPTFPLRPESKESPTD
jgi:hypothetical protein